MENDLSSTMEKENIDDIYVNSSYDDTSMTSMETDNFDDIFIASSSDDIFMPPKDNSHESSSNESSPFVEETSQSNPQIPTISNPRFVPNNISVELLAKVPKDPDIWTSHDVCGITFDNVEQAEEFYKSYSILIGFSIRRDNKETDASKSKILVRRWVCSREGLRTHANSERKNRKREPRRMTRCQCKASFSVRYNALECCYKVTVFNPAHSHDTAKSNQAQFLRSNRSINIGQALQIKAMKKSGIRTCQIMDLFATMCGGYENVGFTTKDLYNFTNHVAKNSNEENDAEAAITYLSALKVNDPGLYYRHDVDKENRLRRIFWADSWCRFDYEKFGDVLVIDSTYKKNAFRLPLVVFVGTNHHMNNVIFGCALVSEEDIDSYEWAFYTFLHAMAGKHPLSVISDGDRSIISAVSTVMPQTKHRLCSWHLMRNARQVSTSNDFLESFKNVMLSSYSHAEFEIEWLRLMNKYNLHESTWMSDMYEKKMKWAEAFFFGVFFAGMTTNGRCESTNAYLSRFLHTNLGLLEFVKQFFRALNRNRQTELKNEFNNHQSDQQLRTHLTSIERSALEFYTCAVFMEIRAEIAKDTMITPKEEKCKSGYKCFILKKYMKTRLNNIKVTFSEQDQTFTCTCGLFEANGWPCSHMFAVMKMCDFSAIPPALLQNRWCKNVIPDGERLNSTMPISMIAMKDIRFGTLHGQCLQLCSVASESEDLYKQAMDGVSVFTNQIMRSSTWEEQPILNKKHRPYKPAIMNPNVVRTKGSEPEGKGKKSGQRLCGICREPGHKRSTCKKLDVGARIQKDHKSKNSIIREFGLSDIEDPFLTELSPSTDDDIFC